jgi:Ni/Co efflux regulator RcnB
MVPEEVAMVRTLVAALMAAGLVALPASADQGKGKGKSKGKEKVVVKDKDDRREVVVFTDRDRDVVRTYWVQTYGRGKCPPGLAKKGNGCLPPGLAKQRYVIGQPLPRTVVIERLPPVLVTRLGPPPVGYEYVVVDGDLLKLAVGTRLVVDAVHAIVD